MSLEWRDKDARFGLLLFICFFFGLFVFLFSYLFPDGRSYNPDLTGLCQPTPHDHIKVTQVSRRVWNILLAATVHAFIFGQWRCFTTQTPNPSHNPNVQWKPKPWLTDFLCLGVENVLGQSSSAALLCWGSRLWRYGNIKSKLSVPICPTVCAILGRS